MEFVIATFPTVRSLRIDGAPQGQTGQLVGVQRGHHIFDLGNPKDYLPASVPAAVTGTSQAQPMVIPFHPAVEAVPPAPVGPARGGVTDAVVMAPPPNAPPSPGAMASRSKVRAAKPEKKQKKRAAAAKAPARPKATAKKIKPASAAKAKRHARMAGARRGPGPKKTRSR